MMGRTDMPSMAIGAAMLVFSLAATGILKLTPAG